MRFDLNEWLEATRKERDLPRDWGRSIEIRPRIECADGFTMSVQADQSKWCWPRRDDGPYVEVEVGFPSQADDLLMPYAYDATKPTGTMYGNVPVYVVEAVVAQHGGLATPAAPAPATTEGK